MSVTPIDTALASMDKLTHKQRMFIVHYLGECQGNATAAARAAGYSGNAVTLASQAHDTLSIPQVSTVISQYARAIMSEHETVSHLAAMIRKPDEDYAVATRNRYGEVINVRYDLGAKVRAIELMLKYQGLLVERSQVAVAVQQVKVTELRPINPYAGTADDRVVESKATEATQASNDGKDAG